MFIYQLGEIPAGVALLRAEMTSPYFFYITLITSILLVFSHRHDHRCYLVGSSAASATAAAAADDDDDHQNYSSTIIGAIIDANSRKGKEETTAMRIAVDNFNNIIHSDSRRKLHLVFRNFTGELHGAVLAGEELIKAKKVQVIVGMDTWQQAALAAEVGTRAQVPVLSLAASARLRPPSTPTGLVQMGSNVAEQITCISAIVGSYQWRRVVAIYEDDAYGSNAELLTLLSEALRRVGSEIDCHLSLPPLTSSSDPREAVHQELSKLLSVQTRVFIVLQSSVPMAAYLFQEARRMDFMGKDSAWIVTDSISSFLDSMDTAVIPYMEGALGIKSYYSKSSKSFLEFSAQFQKNFTSEYPEEENPQPGIHALRAYDTIDVITRALARSVNDTDRTTTTTSPKTLLKNILSSHFTGLSGTIDFGGGRHLPNSNSALGFRIINIVGKGYRELDFWTLDIDNPFTGAAGVDGMNYSRRNATRVLDGPVIWPGYLKRVPKGWEIPADAKPLNIGIRAHTSFEKFVKVDLSQTDPLKKYTGFCIDIFREVLKILEQNHSLPYKFYTFHGTYDDLVDSVHNKTYDAAVGDMTILSSRSEKVEFTVPYAESGLVIVQAAPEEAHNAWMFMKPFTGEMWVATAALLVYTMSTVWLLEYRSNNPAFRGPWSTQLGTALWFSFCSLFFAHREEIRSNTTRLVAAVWLSVVFVLAASYTASLSSMLTVRRLEPYVTDLQRLKATNSVIGCDGDSFVKKYLEGVAKFNRTNIKDVTNEYLYPGDFQSGNISAAVLELPYAKVFMSQFCKNYTSTQLLNRYGGLGFAFQKGSPLAADFSKAILTISEDGILKQLEDKWFPRSAECSSTETDELSLGNFWALYLICAATSTLCLLLFFLHLLIDFNHHQALMSTDSSSASGDDSVWMKTVRLVHFFHHNTPPTTNQVFPITERPLDDLTPTGDERVAAVATPESGDLAQASPPNATATDHKQKHPQPPPPPLPLLQSFD